MQAVLKIAKGEAAKLRNAEGGEADSLRAGAPQTYEPQACTRLGL